MELEHLNGSGIQPLSRNAVWWPVFKDELDLVVEHEL
jgi:hypothetical protein